MPDADECGNRAGNERELGRGGRKHLWECCHEYILLLVLKLESGIAVVFDEVDSQGL